MTGQSDFTLDKSVATFGVAGNFTGHLEQAGEAADFVNVQTKEEHAPKAVFPTYIPQKEGTEQQNLTKGAGGTPDFLHVFPFSSDKIQFPKGEQKLQIEPECAILFSAAWRGGKITALEPIFFGASNDCSIRKPGAKKISVKKNWGANSKGFSAHAIRLDSFSEEGSIHDYRIASFLVRNGEVFDYGEDSRIRDYSYVYKKLSDWLIDRLNNQKDEGPAEDISGYLRQADCPKRILISIGATRYTPYGETTFLKDGDKAVVVLYPETAYSHEEIRICVKESRLDAPDISSLCQTVICE